MPRIEEKQLNAVFIKVDIDAAVGKDPAIAAKLEEVCPVDIFATDHDGRLKIVEENLDECVLCELCLDAAPRGTIEVKKLYDGTSLSR
ncbi:MAG: 4Fe-4S dicluster domain-containing protein [Solirubrobacterales bacterium]|jgi:NAD-dependent dihydropyrimidine dehydrogenase PreA subunit